MIIEYYQIIAVVHDPEYNSIGDELRLQAPPPCASTPSLPFPVILLRMSRNQAPQTRRGDNGKWIYLARRGHPRSTHQCHRVLCLSRFPCFPVQFGVSLLQWRGKQCAESGANAGRGRGGGKLRVHSVRVHDTSVATYRKSFRKTKVSTQRMEAF